jgi:hypothetical protein
MKIIINQGREILLLGSVREPIMTLSETSSEKKYMRVHLGRILIFVPKSNCFIFSSNSFFLFAAISFDYFIWMKTFL